MTLREDDIPLPDTTKILYTERLATKARKHGDHSRAKSLYKSVLDETEEYLLEIENVEEQYELTSEEETTLEEIQSDLEQLERSVENELNRL